MDSEKGQRLLKVFLALKAHPIIGISNKEIADELGIPPVHVSQKWPQFCARGFTSCCLKNGVIIIKP